VTRRAVGASGRPAGTPAGIVGPPGVARPLCRQTVAAAMGTHGASVTDVAAVLGQPALPTTGIDAQLARGPRAAVARPGGGGTP